MELHPEAIPGECTLLTCPLATAAAPQCACAWVCSLFSTGSLFSQPFFPEDFWPLHYILSRPPKRKAYHYFNSQDSAGSEWLASSAPSYWSPVVDQETCSSLEGIPDHFHWFGQNTSLCEACWEEEEWWSQLGWCLNSCLKSSSLQSKHTDRRSLTTKPW